MKWLKWTLSAGRDWDFWVRGKCWGAWFWKVDRASGGCIVGLKQTSADKNDQPNTY